MTARYHIHSTNNNLKTCWWIKTGSRIARLIVGMFAAWFAYPAASSDAQGFIVTFFIFCALFFMVGVAVTADDGGVHSGTSDLIVPPVMSVAGLCLFLIWHINSGLSDSAHHGITIFGMVMLWIPTLVAICLYNKRHGIISTADWESIRYDVQHNWHRR